MSTGKILFLGAVAGLTIFLGLPVARLRKPAPRLKAFLNTASVGILVFLLYDVFAKAVEPVNAELRKASDGTAGWTRFAVLAAIMAGGFVIGLMALVYYDRYQAGRRPLRDGGAAVAVPVGQRAGLVARLNPAERLAFFIALGIGLHNFGEGLAIGQSAAKGDLKLATVLIVGFALHNATEGFGITGPLAAESARPTWRFLGVMGLIGGGPTFLGTVVGQAIVNDLLYVAFLALAAGSILYVIMELVGVAKRLGYKEVAMWGIVVGVTIGFATDMVLTAAGA
ncbi:MAG: ZIP family metal transporter [Acidimicrobiales bacterium]